MFGQLIKKTTDIIGTDITDFIHKDYIHAVLNRVSKIKEGVNRALPSINPTKKAIVLQPVAGTPTTATPQEKTTWLN